MAKINVNLEAFYGYSCGGHDHVFVAERVGLDLDACRDDEVDYIITFSEQCLWIQQKSFITAAFEKRGIGRTDWRDVSDDVM